MSIEKNSTLCETEASCPTDAEQPNAPGASEPVATTVGNAVASFPNTSQAANTLDRFEKNLLSLSTGMDEEFEKVWNQHRNSLIPTWGKNGAAIFFRKGFEYGLCQSDTGSASTD